MDKKLQAVLFDLDGTLADTQMDLADSTNRILTKNNFPTHDYEAYKFLVGKGLKMLITNALPESDRNEETISILLKDLIADYKENCLNKTVLYNGIPELLDNLNKENIPIVVFTNKDHNLAMIVCNALLKEFRIEAVLGRTDEKPRKPDPAGALYLSDKLRISPQNILFIGDTDNDMICANRAGMPSVGVLWGFRDKKELQNSGATFIVEKPSEILSILKSGAQL